MASLRPRDRAEVMAPFGYAIVGCGWVAEAQSARAPAEVARLLLELEEVTLWSAVDGSWRAARPGWVAELSAVAARAGRSVK